MKTLLRYRSNYSTLCHLFYYISIQVDNVPQTVVVYKGQDNHIGTL
jgi:hypothetical protein